MSPIEYLLSSIMNRTYELTENLYQVTKVAYNCDAMFVLSKSSAVSPLGRQEEQGWAAVQLTLYLLDYKKYHCRVS